MCELANKLSTPPSALLGKNLEALETDLCKRKANHMHHVQSREAF